MYRFPVITWVGLILIILSSCNPNNKVTTKTIETKRATKPIRRDSEIIDCNYTFDQAITGTKAPKEIIDNLDLISVKYISTDGKIHKGQILTNKEISSDIKAIFDTLLSRKFVVERAIPIVKYDWNDDASMQNNNSYSFCYRNVSFSKHATGMAIDINPYFNPVCWKKGYKNRINKPIGAQRDTTVNGTFYSSHPVLKEFRKFGFFWGHNFKSKFDDHHFEK